MSRIGRLGDLPTRSFGNLIEGSLANRITELERRLNEMAGEVASLTAIRNDLATWVQNATLLLNRLKAMADDASSGINPLEIQTEINALTSIRDSLKTAVETNTP